LTLRDLHDTVNKQTFTRASAENFQKGATKKRPKNSKKIPKNSTIKPLSEEGGGQRKKDRKIALLSLYLLYLHHAWKSRRGARPSCPPMPTPMII